MEKVLSVIFPVHNKAGTLPRVLSCLQEQDFPACRRELIFIADRCTDESLGILRAFRESEEVQVISAEGGSAAQARNTGLRASTGSYCLFLDPDIIIPPDFFSKVVRHLKSSSRTVCLAPVHGNSNSLSTWPFVIQDHAAWLNMTNAEVLDWAASQDRLQDLRTEFADERSGDLGHLAAPWVFCWSSALAVERESMIRAGGFNQNFRNKGSEDLELGYRLHCIGTRFKLMLDAHVFHMPHARDRDLEERLDRLHEREMLKLHPSREMEALCAFDGSHANPMLDQLTVVDSRRINELATLLETPVKLEALKLPAAFQLVVGVSPSWLNSANESSFIACPYSLADERRIPLFGFALPFEDQALDRAVVVGVWQLLPERLACRIIDEAARVATEVYLLKVSRPRVPVPSWSYKTLENNDAPYWERTQRVRRSFFDFELSPCGQDGAVYSYRVSRLTGGSYT